MTLERRDGSTYYYRSVRNGAKVRKEYVGTGELAEMASRTDEAIRAHRQERRAWEVAELERMEALAAPALELDEAAQILARAHLIASGCHRRKGEWRRARDA